MAKFTDAQLSRILSTHTADGLQRGGAHDENEACCILQAAYADIGASAFNGTASWFDLNYDKSWSVDKFVAEMRKQGLV